MDRDINKHKQKNHNIPINMNVSIDIINNGKKKSNDNN